eukprot:s858_g31.t1
MGCGASAALAPLRKLDASKFTKVFEKENITEIAWLDDDKCLLLSWEKVIEEGAPTRDEDPFYKPPVKATVEGYDVKSKAVKVLSTVVSKFAHPCMAASVDGKMYVVGLGQELHLFNADGSEISKMKVFDDEYTDCFSISVSPDGKHIAAASGHVKMKVMSVDGTEVFDHQINGNHKPKAGLHWWNNNTALVVSDMAVELLDISAKTVSGQWWGPPKGVGSYTHSINPVGMHIMKSGKSFVAHRDDGQLFRLKGGDGGKFTVEETYKLHEREYGNYNGTRFVVLKDEQTIIYERPKGNRDNADPEPDHLVSHVLASGEKVVLVRGEDAKLAKAVANFRVKSHQAVIL